MKVRAPRRFTWAKRRVAGGLCKAGEEERGRRRGGWLVNSDPCR